MPGLGLTLAPRPYGVFAVETMDSYGGWIATPVDYLRFVLSIDGRRGAAALNAAALAEMNAPSRLTSASMADTDAADDGALWTAKTSVKKWPEGDLFGSP